MNDISHVSPDWYVEWATLHATAFGLSDKCVGTMLAWGPVWSRLYSAEELHDATRRMTADPAPLRFASDHRPAILAHVQRHRDRARREEATRSPEDGYAARGCTICGDGGVVVVPHPGIDARGRWVGYLTVPTPDARTTTDARLLTMTAGVCCVCERGQRSAEACAERGRPSMTLVGYERLYPNWQQVAAAREAIVNLPEREPTAAEVQQAREFVRRVVRRAADGFAGAAS